MVNDKASANVTRGTVSNGEMLAILNNAGLKISKISPLARVTGQPAPPDSRKLQSAGLTDNAGRPTPSMQEALTILANPSTEIDLIWGSPDGISLSKVYSAAGQDKLVSFTNSDNSINISFFLSLQDITDLMAQKLVFTEIKNITPLDAEITPAALPALFGALDIYRESQLRGALERRQETAVIIDAGELNRIVQEAKTETNLSWYAPVAYNVVPAGIAVTESSINEGLEMLKKEGLIGSGGELSSDLNTFANRAFPIAGFFGIKVVTSNGSSLEKTQFALFRGLSTLLLAQFTENNTVQISSISTSDLPELLFNMGTRAMETPPPAAKPAAATATVACGKCGTVNNTSSKFCSKCGAALSAPPSASAPAKFCTKCGAQTSGTEKFCKKCGTPLK